MPADAIFSVDHLPPEQRFEVWRDSISAVFDVSRDRLQTPDAAFRGSLHGRMVGEVMLAQATTSRQSWQRSAVTMARTGMDQIMLQHYVHGTQRVTWRGGSLDMPKTGLLVYDLTQEMRAESTDMTNLSLILPRAQVEELIPRVEDLHMQSLPGTLPMVAHLRDLMMALWNSADNDLAAQQGPGLVETVAATLRAGQRGDDSFAMLSAGPLLNLLRHHIESHLTDPDLGPEQLARRFGLSRSRLYELFTPFEGVAAYIRERRLNAARRALLDPAWGNLPIGAIAARFCFNHSDFSRAFLKRFGLSPRAARHYASRDRQESKGLWFDRRYEAWLRPYAASQAPTRWTLRTI